MGVLPGLATFIKCMPGICKTSATPTENQAITNAMMVNEPIKISGIPINLANTLKKNMIMSANVSKKFFEVDFMVLPPFLAAPETDFDTFLAASDTLSATFSKPSLIFFSMLLMLTGSPVIIIFSAVVVAAGTKIQNRI